ncbi:hypothetical protein ACWA5Z_04010 [Testudinibacter sp. P80/BLE/0925]|uniref:hypothetical protein n=1 Tax=Testudinibacter sp. TW-1 TaxID=3417757 RepID=UPI003D35D90F
MSFRRKKGCFLIEPLIFQTAVKIRVPGTECFKKMFESILVTLIIAATIVYPGKNPPCRIVINVAAATTVKIAIKATFHPSPSAVLLIPYRTCAFSTVSYRFFSYNLALFNRLKKSHVA